MNILLIDDDESVRDIITYTILAKFKAEIMPASSYEEAISLIDKSKIDLVISDYYLGDKTGGDIYQYLLEINKYIPFAICSSIDVDEHQAFNDRKFFIGQITKPFIFDGVNQVIKSYEIIHSSMGDLNLSDVTRENSSYSRINISLLSSIKKAQCKIYAQINEEKIVPVFEIDDDITSEKIEKDIFENHVDRSVEFVRKFKEIPMDVDKIILQHHEDPTIEANKSIPQASLTPLSCIFIFAHKVVDILFDLEKENIDPNYDVVNKRIHLDKYNSKNFEKVKEAYLKSELF